MADLRHNALRRTARILPMATTLLFACAAAAPNTGLEQRIVRVAEAVKPSVVHIEAIVKFNDRRSQVTGSGLIVTTDGAILTNHHVIDNAEKIEISVPGRKRKYPARLVGSDRQTDIAVLRIKSDEGFPAASFRATPVRVGQWVLAIGNPYGLEGTVSLGIVSAMSRNLEIPEVLNEFIQTDAMIDRGSSGGPLVDLEGQVVGINSRGQGRGIGFTIPIDTAREVMAQLEDGGIERGYLGISLQAFDRELADYFGSPDSTGVLVNHVLPGSPAADAGLQAGDVITRFSGHSIEAEKHEDISNFQRLVAAVSPGTRIDIDLLREGEIETAFIVIGSQPKLDGAEEESELGFHVQEITEQLARAHRLDSTEGAFVIFVAHGSPAREAGLHVGDVIVQIEDAAIANLDDFRGAMEGFAERRRFLIRARRGDELKFLLLKPGTRSPSDVEEGDAGTVSLPR